MCQGSKVVTGNVVPVLLHSHLFDYYKNDVRSNHTISMYCNLGSSQRPYII